ncbi:MAG: nucleotide exchange factor GrpE [Candidatus Thorarchaeota archaeon]
MEEKNEEEFIEVDVEEVEESKDTEKVEEVDPETKELEEVREEVLNFIKDANTDKLLEKYIALFRDLKENTKLKEEYLETAQMVQAEFENYKKRIYKDQEWFGFQNKQKILQKFLPLFDDIERTNLMFENKPDTAELKEAIGLIFSNLKSIFESLELEIIEPEQEAFNPQFHEIVHFFEGEDLKDNQIMEVVSKGFKLGNIVIRPAKVVISKKAEKEKNEE